MRINYDILKHLLSCNKGIKLRFVEGSNLLEILSFNNVVLSLDLPNCSIEDNSDVIYNAITNLDNITLYIPKIYIKE